MKSRSENRDSAPHGDDVMASLQLVVYDPCSVALPDILTPANTI